jgi:hypothetical protein
MVIESGSTAKMFTAVAALRALELGDGLAGLDTVMNAYLPIGWELHPELDDADVTLGQLLSHRSGLVNTGGIGLKKVLEDPDWFRSDWVGSYHYANHNFDGVGFMTSYLLFESTLRQIEADAPEPDYDSIVDLAVRDAHYDIVMESVLAPLQIEADCIRFAADEQEVWLYTDGKDQDGYKLPARKNCMTSGFLLSAPQWVEWAHGLWAGGLLGAEALAILNNWGDASSALGWSYKSEAWRGHNGGYAPEGVGVRTALMLREDGYSAAVVANSKNVSGVDELARRALEASAFACD